MAVVVRIIALNKAYLSAEYDKVLLLLLVVVPPNDPCNPISYIHRSGNVYVVS